MPAVNPANKDVFNQFKDSVLNIDPVTFCEKYLTLESQPFRLSEGYKPFADIYRYIGLRAIQEGAKPVILVKGRQVGATTMATALEMYFMASGIFGCNGRPPMRIIHCFPNLIHVFSYAKIKLNNAIMASLLVDDPFKPGRKRSYINLKIDSSSPSNDSLQFKQFVGGNFLRIESTGLEADRLRGGTVDCLFYDEVQDIPIAAISNANKLLSQARYGTETEGVQVYFGTPKQRGTDYWKMWNDSSQQYFQLGCEKCKKHFPLYTPSSNDWEKVWLYGFIVKCVHCGHEQDKRPAAERGKWAALNGNENCGFVGYHINQLYMPNFTKEKILSKKPENSPIATERSYQNEVLGEFYTGDAAPITPEELHEKCADIGRKMRASISVSDKKKVYAGFDWGKKQDVEGQEKMGQSYSSAVVITAEGPHLLSVQFATLLRRNDFEYKKQLVEQMFRQYSVGLAVGDIGYANDLTEVLQKEYGNRFLASEAKGNMKNHVKFVTDEFPNTIRFDRDYYIADLFDMLKKGNIRFPYGDYEKISWLIAHCCSMDIKTTSDRFGEPMSHYVKGATPNDGFMALLNAYLAYKFDITGGFNQSTLINPNNVRDDPNARRAIPAVTGYIPRM
jgi:hypothetical protein